MTTMTPNSQSIINKPIKLDFIDSLRGLAALYVVLYHITHAIDGVVLTPSWLAAFVNLGYSGVTLFFVISAFTLCLSMDSRQSKELQPLRNYFIRRVFRIAPLFYFWVAIFCLRNFYYSQTIPEFSELFRNIFFITNLYPGHEAGIVWASWTISVEMLFYVLFPIAFKSLTAVPKIVILLISMLILQVLWYYFLKQNIPQENILMNYFEFSLPYHLSSFIFGILAYKIYKKSNEISNYKKIKISTFLNFFVLVGFTCFFVFPNIIYTYFGWLEHKIISNYLLGFLYACLLISLSMRPMSFIVNRITRFFGKISYSVYLSHVFLLVLLMPAFKSIQVGMKYPAGAFFTAIFLAMLIITLVAQVTYQLIEKNGNHAGKSLIAWLELKKKSNCAV